MATKPTTAQEPCATQGIHEQRMDGDAEYRNAWRAPLPMSELPGDDTGQIYTIPIVVHVIHLGESVGSGSNISNTQIYLAIEKLNRDYRYAYGRDIGIRFCLAKRDPQGRPTSGIVRVDGRSVPGYQQFGMSSSQGNGADETAVKDLSRWPNTEYYNIWVVHDIVGGVAGFAYYPTTYINDGTVIASFYMSPILTTLPHELGHAFDLRHTFQGDGDGNQCPVNSDCSSQGDLICDTPPHRRDDCYITNPCSESGQDFPSVANNFMSYCLLRDRFTNDQRTRMRAAAASYPRILLSQSNACDPLPERDAALLSVVYLDANALNPLCGNAIAVRFSATNRGTEVIRILEVNYNFDNTGAQTASFPTDLGFGDTAVFTLPSIVLSEIAGPHHLDIAVAGINGNADLVPENDSASALFLINDTCKVTAAINEIFEEVRLFPNPVRDGLSFGPMPTRANVRILDITGSLVRDLGRRPSGISRIPVSELPAGMYLLELSNGESKGFWRFQKL